MAIVIRHNGALNAAAEGFSQGFGRGLEQKDANDARKKAQDAEDARLRLADTVAQAEMKIAKDREARQAQEFGIQQQREADRKTAAAQIGEYATSGGRAPNFQPNQVETATPEEQQSKAEDAHATEVARHIGQTAPDLLPAFLDEYKNNKRLQMLKGVAARELSGWDAAGKNPIMGPMMAGDGKNKNELQARADTAREALQAAMQEGTDPDVLAKAVATSAAARQQSWISTAQQMDVQAEVENVSAVASQQINEAEQALQDPRFARVLTPEVRAMMQMGISRARQALMLYGASAGQPGGMTASRLYDGIDAAFRDMGRGSSRGGAVKPEDPPWLQARNLAVEDFDKGLLGDPAQMDAKERERVTRQRQAEYEQRIGGGVPPGVQGPEGPNTQQGPPPISFGNLDPQKQAALMSELSAITSSPDGDAKRMEALKKYGVGLGDIKQGVAEKQQADVTAEKEAGVREKQAAYRAERSKLQHINGPATGMLAANNSARKFADDQRLVRIAKSLKASGHTRSIGGSSEGVADYREKASGELQAALEEYSRAWGEDPPKKVMDEIERLRQEFAREVVK